MEDFKIISLGECGARIGLTFEKQDTIYLNFASTDFKHLPIDPEYKLLLSGEGSGRDPNFGLQFAEGYAHKIGSFLDYHIEPEDNQIVIAVGLSDGSGTGLFFTVAKHLLSTNPNRKILLIGTSPQKEEYLPANHNFLMTFNKLVTSYLQYNKIGCLLVDNDYMIQQFGISSKGYWDHVNKEIVNIFKNVEKLADHKSDFSSLDSKEIQRILFSGGLLDIQKAEVKFGEEIDRKMFKSLYNPNLKLSSARAVVIAVALPHSLKNNKKTPEYVDHLLKTINKMTKTSFVLRSVYYDDVSNVEINLLLSGLEGILGKLVSQVKRNVEKLNNRKSKRVDMAGVGKLKI